MLHLLFLLPTRQFSKEEEVLEDRILDVSARICLLKEEQERLKPGFSVIKYFHSKIYIPLKIRKYERIQNKLVEEFDRLWPLPDSLQNQNNSEVTKSQKKRFWTTSPNPKLNKKNNESARIRTGI